MAEVQSNFFGDSSLDRERERVRRERTEPGGTTCSACAQHAQQYRRNFIKSMAQWLLGLYQFAKGQTTVWAHSHEVSRSINFRSGGVFSVLKWHGLIEQKPNEGTATRVSGIWRMTERGKQFAEGRERVPRYVLTYNDACVGFDGDLVHISDVLPGFNYWELMGWKDED